MTHKDNEVTSMEVVEAVLRASIAGGTGLLAIAHPELSAATAAGAEGAMLIVKQASRKLYEIKANRAIRYVNAVSSESGLSLAELSERLEQSEQMLEIIVTGIEGSTRTPLLEKISALAKVTSEGLDAKIDTDFHISRRKLLALSKVDEDHIELMETLIQPDSGLGPDGLAWHEPTILERLPMFSTTLNALTADLSSIGLIFDAGIGTLGYQPTWKMTPLGIECLGLLKGSKRKD